jgi:hypothetical protein
MINGIKTPVMRIVGNHLRWDLMTFPFQTTPTDSKGERLNPMRERPSGMLMDPGINGRLGY